MNSARLLRLLVPALLAVGLSRADDKWVEMRLGSMEVLSNAGERPAREMLNRLLQVQHTLGLTVGRTELAPLWPVRVLVLKPGKDVPTLPAEPRMLLARDHYTAVVAAASPASAALVEDLCRHLLNDNLGRLPGPVEAGLLRVFSTVEVSATRVTLGTFPPPAERDRDWASMYVLLVDPRHSGKMRVFVSNLLSGADLDTATRNAFETSAAEVEKQAAAVLAGGAPGTTPLSGRPIDPERQLTGRVPDPWAVRLAMADALLPAPSRAAEARGLYEGLLRTKPNAPEALEGLGLLALQAGDKTTATERLRAAIQAGSTSARAHLEGGDPTKAATLNPRWAEPVRRQAAAEPDLARRIGLLKQLVQKAPRDAAAWQTLARSLQEGRLYAESGKAWSAAERAAEGEPERARIRQARAALEEARVEAAAAERRRLAEENARDLQRVKDASLAEVRAAEERMNRRLETAAGGRPRAATAPVKEPPPDSRLVGLLERVDCLRDAVRITVRPTDGPPVSVLVTDRALMLTPARGDANLGCGAQKSPRRVTVDYWKKADAKRGTAGEAAVVDLQ